MTGPIDFGGLFQQMASPHVLLDLDFNIVEMNRAYLNVTMRRREDLLGRNMFEAFPAEGEAAALLRRSLERARTGLVDVLPLIAYAIPVPAALGGGFEDRYWSATHTPIRDGDGEPLYILQHTQDVTELHRAHEAAVTSPLRDDVLRRAEAVQAVNQTLLEERSHLRRLFMQAPGFMCVLTGPELVFEMANHAYIQLVGGREVVGMPIRDALPELRGQGYFELLEQVMRTGQVFVGRGMRAKLGDVPEERIVDFVYQPITEEDGSVSGIFVEGVDITERVRAQDQQRLLMDELNHRVKNTLATVQAIVTQTLRGGGSPESFAADFHARLRALSRAHDTLTQGQWQGADLRQLLRLQLQPYLGERLVLDGPPVLLPPRMALSLGMVLHELTTNAAKYGGLSAAEGRLAVSWRLESGDPAGQRLSLRWGESGGPPVSSPSYRGFGSRLIARSIEGELGGRLDMDYRPDGFVCSFMILLPEPGI